jgi:hypothetical protein
MPPQLSKNTILFSLLNAVCLSVYNNYKFFIFPKTCSAHAEFSWNPCVQRHTG